MFKTTFILVAGLISSLSTFSQEIREELPSFNKVKASSHISVVLKHGENEHIHMEYSGVSEDDINYKVSGNTLEIFLDGAKVSDKTKKVWIDGGKQTVSYYEGARITAYITYTNLVKLELRGEEEARVEDPVQADKFNIRLYGETNVTFNELNADKLKVKLYGENKLHILNGTVGKQKFILYGENDVQAHHLSGGIVKVTSLGENKLNVNAEDKVRILGLGELEVVHSGNSLISKLVLGESRISRQ